MPFCEANEGGKCYKTVVLAAFLHAMGRGVCHLRVRLQEGAEGASAKHFARRRGNEGAGRPNIPGKGRQPLRHAGCCKAGAAARGRREGHQGDLRSGGQTRQIQGTETARGAITSSSGLECINYIPTHRDPSRRRV